ncbi:MAG TPA: sulfate ABC transporter permease subunit [Acidobacteriota bacterium]
MPDFFRRFRADRRPRNPRRNGADMILLGVAFAYAGVLLIGPLAALIWSSLKDGPAIFLREISSPDALHALKLTLQLSAGATAINTVFGLVMAWVFVRDRFKGKAWFNGLVDLPFAVSPVIAGLMLILLFGRGGWLSGLAAALNIRVVFAVPGMLLATVFVTLPFVVREVMPVLEQFGIQQESAAYTIGATPWQTFRLVTLPAIRWGVLYGISLTLGRALGEFGALVIVSGALSGSTETSTLFIFRSLDDRNYTAAYSMALVLAVVSFSVLILMEFFRKRAGIKR